MAQTDAQGETEGSGAAGVDPVCHMTVKIAEDTPKSQHNGQAYYFCCVPCQKAFDKDPARYLP